MLVLMCSTFLAFLARRLATRTMGKTVRVEPVIERHSQVQAMSHNEAHTDVLHLIADNVVQFLTRHDEWPSMEREMERKGMEEGIDQCLLYQGIYPSDVALKTDYCCLVHREQSLLLGCERCRTAWILTQVSKDMKARAQAFGK